MEEIELNVNCQETIERIEDILNEVLEKSIINGIVFKLCSHWKSDNPYSSLYYMDVYNCDMLIHDGICYISNKPYNIGVCEMRMMTTEEKLELVSQISMDSTLVYVERNKVTEYKFMD